MEKIKDKRTNINNSPWVFLLRVIIVISFTAFMYHLFSTTKQDEIATDQFYQNKASAIMMQECAKSCSNYGIVLNSLKGPKMEYRSVTRNTDIYEFSWYSTNPDIKLTIRTKSLEPAKIVWTKN
jgi:hypothetical protein